MAEPTREEIQTAYEALETLTNTCIHSGDLAEELQELVLRALPPKPQPTMADVEWDDDVHYLAEAEHVDGGTAIMLSHEMGFDRITILRTEETNKFFFASPGSLTPTGRRYTLTEVQDD